MVFKKPVSGRNERSGGSSDRYKKTGDRPKRSSSSRENSPRSFDQTEKNSPPKYNSERTGSRRNSSSGTGKPQADNTRRNDDRPAKKYGNAGNSESGEKRPYSTPRNKPYSGRYNPDDKPVRKYGNSDHKEQDEKRPYSSSRSKSYPGRAGAIDKPERSFRNTGNGEPNEKRPYSSSRSKSYSGRSNSDDKPGRNFSAGKKFGRDGDDKKFSRAGQSKRETGNFSDRPARARTLDETGAPVKTMRSRKEKENKDGDLIRLNRYIANAGICSRRKADELIEAGIIAVNGQVIAELGFKVNPLKDEIRYNGELLKREKMVYVLLNKPKDYITTTEDPQERRTVMHLVEKASRERIYPIGRLDRNTTGLLLMTNDGDLADKLSHPRSNVAKLYQAELNKSLTQGDLNKIGFGIELEDGLIKPDAISYVQGGTKREVGIQIHSGKNRIVRRIFEHLGYEVVKLDRVVYANLTKKDLPRGRWRYLDEKEVIQLKHLI